ncbi:hypothetical protein FA15DRAFT_758427 [Coprinopsis marcescibilis]|uniref:Uncharacterized protein n=1 Tax=Coprinopsis marcescibilis TaxID=230819 RepID=A0A5C3KP23_COPMA|nr:hypothetical protein FA15DRAFT_758427 [Coprinopsis marcescibilis]
MGSLQNYILQLQEQLLFFRGSQFAVLAAATVLVYDIALTLDQEASSATMLACYLVIYQSQIWIPDMFGISGCLSFCAGPLCHTLLSTFWLPFCFFETLILVLTIWKTIRNDHDAAMILRIDWRNTHKKRVTDPSPRCLIEVIREDGLLYYLVIIAVSVGNMLVWLFAPYGVSYVGVSLMKGLQATMCSRLLLNIRGFITPPDSEDKAPLPTICFAPRPQSIGSVSDVDSELGAFDSTSSRSS